MLYLMRHGLDDETYVGGWSDVGLVSKGIDQVIEAANSLKNSDDIIINNIVSSSVKRAEETAQIVAQIMGINSYSVSSTLKEQNKGDLNGMPIEEVNSLYPEYASNVDINTTYPNGESLIDLYKRIKDNLEYFNSLADGTLLITHRGVINMLYYILNDIPLDMDKGKFAVTHASIHEYDSKNKSIRKVL